MYLFIFPTKNGKVSAVWVVLHVSDRFTEWNEGVHLCSDRSSKQAEISIWIKVLSYKSKHPSASQQPKFQYALLTEIKLSEDAWIKVDVMEINELKINRTVSNVVQKLTVTVSNEDI